jgi:ubiquinone/menaquinone biosynthesis C-methylase UbiE
MERKNRRVDFGVTAHDYAAYRQGFPNSLMSRLRCLGVGLPGQSVLDLGTGTGLFGFDFARCGCRVVGIDPSERMLERARSAASQQGLEEVKFICGVAENTELPSNSFDVVAAGTAWHWFDMLSAAREARRLLRPQGRLAIATLEWHLLPENVLSKTMQLIESFLSGKRVPNRSTLRYPEWAEGLVEAGFTNWELFGYVEALTYTHESWRGRVRASQGVGPCMSPPDLKAFDDALAQMLTEDFEEPLLVDHRINAIVAW